MLFMYIIFLKSYSKMILNDNENGIEEYEADFPLLHILTGVHR